MYFILHSVVPETIQENAQVYSRPQTMVAMGDRGRPDVSSVVEPLTRSATTAPSHSSASPGPSLQRQERGQRSVIEPTERGRQPSCSRRLISSSPSPDSTTSSKRRRDEDNEDCDIEELSRNLWDEAHRQSELVQAWKRVRKHPVGAAGQGPWDVPAV